MDCQFFLIIIKTVLTFICGMLTSVHLVQSVENADYFTVISGCSIARMILTTLWVAGTIDTAQGLGDSSHSLST